MVVFDAGHEIIPERVIKPDAHGPAIVLCRVSPRERRLPHDRGGSSDGPVRVSASPATLDVEQRLIPGVPDLPGCGVERPHFEFLGQSGEESVRQADGLIQVGPGRRAFDADDPVAVELITVADLAAEYAAVRTEANWAIGDRGREGPSAPRWGPIVVQPIIAAPAT